MSVANIAFHDNEIWILSDTMTYGEDGKPSSLSERKTEVSPAGRYMWTTRGSVAVGNMWDAVARRCQTLDEAEAALLHWADSMPADVLAAYQSGRRRKSVVEVTLAGWSDRADDLAVYQVEIYPGRPEPTVQVFDRGVCALPGREWSLPKSVTRDQFLKLALAQWNLQDKHDAPMCIGGLMHLTIATRAGCVQEIAGLYPDYHQHAAMLGDPNAAAVALWLGEHEVIAA